MNLAVVGVGYVGLVAATCLAESGHDVCALDSDREKIRGLQAGRIPIYERGLEELVQRNLREGRLRFTADAGEAFAAAEVIFIAVGTPPGADGAADLSAVFGVAREIGRRLRGYRLVVVKSTVPVGTGDAVEAMIREHYAGEFDVASNPEFLKEGMAVDDFMRPDRVVVGVASDRAAALLQEIYAPFVRTENPILVMDRRSAEMTKYAANAMLAAKISFINEMANLCERLDADINAVRRGIGFDSRIGFKFLFPGIGYGGSCFPKDVDALARLAEAAGYRPRILQAVQAVNQDQKKALVEKVRSHFAGNLRGKTFALWGLAFKPQTDDVREAPALEIIRSLQSDGAAFRVYDPVAMAEAKKIFGNSLTYCETPYQALEGAAALLIATEWNEFRRPNFEKLRQLLAQPVIFDGRNLYEPEALAKQGFTYYSIGRRPVRPG